jgi:hypothetical protein
MVRIGMLRAFHHHCMRSMCRLDPWHTRHNHVHVETSTLATRLGIQAIETHIALTLHHDICDGLGTCGGCRAETRLPKQLLIAWLPQNKRPVGRPELTSIYGQTVVRTVRAVEATGGLAQPAAAVAAAAAAVAAAVATKAVDVATVALRVAGTEPREARQLSVTACFTLAQAAATAKAAAAAAAAAAAVTATAAHHATHA